MFDDQPLEPESQVPHNLPAEPADMLENVEKDDTLLSSAEKSSPAFPNALSSGLLKKKESGSVPVGGSPVSMPAMAVEEAGGGAFVGTAIKILGALVVVGGLGVGGWWFYTSFVGGEPEMAVVAEENTIPEVVQTTVSDTSLEVVPTPTYQTPAISQSATVTARTNNDAILFGELTDTDKDGLSDMRERELGTGINSLDSDGDTVSDSDEVLVWKTNPLSSDTDGDSYPDGTEIKNGYNPLGPGRLVLPGAATSTQ